MEFIFQKWWGTSFQVCVPKILNSTIQNSTSQYFFNFKTVFLNICLRYRSNSNLLQGRAEMRLGQDVQRLLMLEMIFWPKKSKETFWHKWKKKGWTFWRRWICINSMVMHGWRLCRRRANYWKMERRSSHPKLSSTSNSNLV